MKRLNTLRLAVAAAVLACGQVAIADTQSVLINANITATCLMTSYPAMTITLDPTAVTDGTGTSSVQYKCTKGTAGTFTVQTENDGSVSRTLNGPGGDTLPITITWTAPSGFTGNGVGTTATANTVVLTGTIANADYVTKTAGAYTGSVSVTIAP